jgi:hypothetical protein
MPEREQDKVGLPDQRTVPDYDPTNDMNNNKEAPRIRREVQPRADLTPEEKKRAQEVLGGFEDDPGCIRPNED